jgi:CubicO group peptidase (beta-lactamase class C family)
MPPSNVVVHGYCAPRFEPVRAAFVGNFHDGLEVGAATSVVVDGETMVDIWAGHADKACTKPWNEDTLVQVMSTTKGMTALVMMRLIERRLVDPAAPVARYWPEFGRAGKESITVEQILTHRAGLPAPDRLLPPGTQENWKAITELLAGMSPQSEPGAVFAYHAVTFGFLVGEVIRRVTGKTVGTLIREEIARPLGVDFELGFGRGLDPRIASLVPAAPAPDGIVDLVKAIQMNPIGPLGRAILVSIPRTEIDPNTPEYRAAEIPASNGHTNARALARIYGALARGGELDGVRLLTAESIARATKRRVGGIEATMLMDINFGLGFSLAHPTAPTVGPRTFGHAGLGGSVGLADPDQKLGFGYLMNQLGHATGPHFVRDTAPQSPPADPRADAILRAVYAAL